MQRHDSDFDLAATINIKKLMRSTPDLHSARLQLRLDWENDHWNAVVSSSEAVAVPGVKQDADGVLTLRRVRAAPNTPAPPGPPPPRGRTPIRKVAGRLRRIAGQSPAGTRARRADRAVGICAPGGSLLS